MGQVAASALPAGYVAAGSGCNPPAGTKVPAASAYQRNVLGISYFIIQPGCDSWAYDANGNKCALPDRCVASVPANAGQPVAPPPPSAPTYSPAIGFHTGSGNLNNPTVGDTWRIDVTGAPPGATVAVNGNTQGVTDANGTFSKSGTFDAGTVGQWNENWTVNGKTVGNWNFTVSKPAEAAAAPPAYTAPSRSTYVSNIAGPVETVQPAGFPSPTDQTTTTQASTGFFSTTILGIPLWIWLAGGAGAYFLFFSQDGGARRGR